MGRWLMICVSALVGCAAPRAQIALVPSSAESPFVPEIDLIPYLDRQSDRVFVRSDGYRAEAYPQVVGLLRRIDGMLYGHALADLAEYISGRRTDWPQADFPVYFIEFDPPIPEWPSQITSGIQAEWNAGIICHPMGGAPLSGTAIRQVWLEGREDVTVRGETYTNCVVLGSNTVFDLGLLLAMEMKERVWLSEGTGVVRRTQTVAGRILGLIGLSATYEYDLDNRAECSGSDNPVPRRFSRMAIQLDSKIPLKINGVLVEWDKNAREEH